MEGFENCEKGICRMIRSGKGKIRVSERWNEEIREMIQKKREV